MKRWLVVLIPSVLIVVLLAYVVGSRAIPQSAQDNFANAAAAPDTSNLPDDNVAQVLPEVPVNTQTAISPSANVASPAADNETAPDNANTGTPDARDDDAEAQAQARREIGAAIRKATLAALDGGEPTHWHKDGLEGDIVVSEPQDDGQDGSCRNVSATMGTDDDRRQSGDHVWCQASDGGDWAPRDR